MEVCKLATKKTSAKTGTKGKKTPGKSNVLASELQAYKPTIYLDDKQIPAGMKNAKVGSSVNLVVTGKIISKSERSDRDGTSNSVQIEIGKMQPGKGK